MLPSEVQFNFHPHENDKPVEKHCRALSPSQGKTDTRTDSVSIDAKIALSNNYVCSANVEINTSCGFTALLQEPSCQTAEIQSGTT